MIPVSVAAEVDLAVGVMAGPPAAPPAVPAPRVVNPDRLVRFIKSAPVVGAIPVSGLLTFDLDGPKTGYQWTVRRITVSDAGGVTNTMGAAAAYVYAGQAAAGLITPGNLEWIIPTLPNVANFSADQLVLQYGEHLLVQVAGGTSGEAVIVSVAYQLYAPGARSGGVQV